MNQIRKGRFVFTRFLLGGLMMFSGCAKDAVQPRTTTYSLKVKDVLGVLGTVTFVETNPAVTTVNITLTGAEAGIHPAQLCMNTVVEGGNVKVILNPVGVNGTSSTAINNMSYATLIAYDGYIKVLQSDQDANIILAEGDIGGNVLTNANKSYDLSTIGTFGVTGKALFEQRLNGNTLVTITMNGLLLGGKYDASINLGSIASIGGGPVVETLNKVDGTTGKSFTNITELDSKIAITYDNWLVYDGYINIYQSKVSDGTVISHGNIGSN